MRFAIAAAVLATSISAQSTSTDFITELVTVVSCHSTVTNCPARSTSVATNIIPVVTTAAPAPAVTSSPAAPLGTAPAGGAGPAQSSDCQPVITVTGVTKTYTTVLTSVEYQTLTSSCAAPAPTGVAPPAAGAPAPSAGNDSPAPAPAAPAGGDSPVAQPSPSPEPTGAPPFGSTPGGGEGNGDSPAPAPAPVAPSGFQPVGTATPPSPPAPTGMPVLSGGVSSFSGSALAAAAAGVVALVFA